MVFNENQKPIPVATQDYATGDFTGIVSGFGAPGAGKDSTEKLQYVEVKVLSQPECLASQRPYTNPKHICSLERFGKGFCQVSVLPYITLDVSEKLSRTRTIRILIPWK